MTTTEASEPSVQGYVADLMLMRLGRWLRLMGQDVAHPEGKSDGEILNQAKRDHRTVITRDKRLWRSCLKADQPCLFIRSSRIEEQLLEAARAGLPLRLDPRRCTLCNGLLKEIAEVGKGQWQCQRCGKVYWRASHWRKMESMLHEICSRKEED